MKADRIPFKLFVGAIAVIPVFAISILLGLYLDLRRNNSSLSSIGSRPLRTITITDEGLFQLKPLFQSFAKIDGRINNEVVLLFRLSIK